MKLNMKFNFCSLILLLMQVKSIFNLAFPVPKFAKNLTNSVEKWAGMNAFYKNMPFFKNSVTKNCRPVETPVGTISEKPIGLCNNCCYLDVEHHVKLYLVFEKHCDTPILIRDDNIFKVNDWDPNSTVILYFHGYGQGRRCRPALNICEAYMKRPEKYNYIFVEYGLLTPHPWYYEAINNIPHICQIIAKRIHHFDSLGVLKIKKVHAIGHSFGAQVAGQFGSYFKLNDKTIPRITGLDPALPLFEELDRDFKLTSDDADYVDVIHTNAGIMGYAKPVGNADFYVNGGAIQPVCGTVPGIDSACSHLIAIDYYVDTLENPHIYPVFKNNSVSYMGLLAPESKAYGTFNISIYKSIPPLMRSC